MKSLSILTAAVLAALALAACDRPGTKTGAASPTTTSTTTMTDTTPPASPARSADATPPNSSQPAANTPASSSGQDSTNVVTDTLVTGKVKAAITADSGMKNADISVKTENGLVTLTGSAKSPDQITLASALAQRQDGVNRVENQVTVK